MVNMYNITIKGYFETEKAEEFVKKLEEIVKETEKAYYLLFNTDFGKINTWVPKSVCTVDTVENCENNEVVKIAEGMIVNHKKFGTGTVLTVQDFQNDQMITVKFGKKTMQLMRNFAHLEIA